MTFDKSKVYNALTVDKYFIGAKGYFVKDIEELKYHIEYEYKLGEFKGFDDNYVYQNGTNTGFNFFYLIEPPPNVDFSFLENKKIEKDCSNIDITPLKYFKESINYDNHERIITDNDENTTPIWYVCQFVDENNNCEHSPIEIFDTPKIGYVCRFSGSKDECEMYVTEHSPSEMWYLYLNICSGNYFKSKDIILRTVGTISEYHLLFAGEKEECDQFINLVENLTNII